MQRGDDGLITVGPGACQPPGRNRSHIVLANRRERAKSFSEDPPFGLSSERAGARLRVALRLEGRSVKEPDRQSADRDDAKKDQHEGDVRLPLWVVLSEAVHQAKLWRGRARNASEGRRVVGTRLPRPMGRDGSGATRLAAPRPFSCRRRRGLRSSPCRSFHRRRGRAACKPLRVRGAGTCSA